MRIYETTFIVNPQVEEATIDRQVKAVANIITQNGGKIVQANHMGTRRLAYEINGLTQGFYGGFIFEAANQTLPPLERHYKLNEAYLRHLTVRFEGDLAELQVEKSVDDTFRESVEEDSPAEKAAAETDDTTSETESVEPEDESKDESEPSEETEETTSSEDASEDTEELL